MAKLYIPACGDRITLINSWEFPLYLEHRNIEFAKQIELYVGKQKWGVYNSGKLAALPCTLKPSTVLECDRVYIRATSKSADSAEDSYDSISWKVIVNGKAAVKQRFWAKLSDCCNIEFDPTNVSTYQSRK
jgi:hypothetical protein